MGTMPPNGVRYTLWTAPDCAPPLPKKRDPSQSTRLPGENGLGVLPIAEGVATRPGRSISLGSSGILQPVRGSSGSGDTLIRSATDEYPTEDRFIFGDCPAAGDAKALQDAVANPANWTLRNRQTGQEVDATTFIEALLQQQNQASRRVLYSTSPPLVQLSGWMSRRHRSNGHVRPRPTLLTPSHRCSLDESAPAAPPSPSSMNLLSRTRSGSPSQPRGRPSVAANTAPVRNSSSHERSNSASSSRVGVGAGDVDVFKLSRLRTVQIVPQLHPGGIRAVSFSPSGAYLATAGADHRCFVFRVQGDNDRGCQALEESTSNGERNSAAEGNRASRRDSRGNLARLIDDEPMRILSGHVADIACLSWAPDDSALLTASADGTVRCWYPLEGDSCGGVFEHGGRVTSVEWDPASNATAPDEDTAQPRRFLTGCMDARLRIFSDGEPEAADMVLARKPVTAVAFAPGGVTFAAGFIGGDVGFYRTDGMLQLASTECRRHGIRHTATQHARHATSPVRRLSASTGALGGGGGGGGRASGGGRAGKAGSRDADGGGGGRRRRNTMGGAAGPGRRGAAVVEERVTGLCYRPRPTAAAGTNELGIASRAKFDRRLGQSKSEDTLAEDAMGPENSLDLSVSRAPTASVLSESSTEFSSAMLEGIHATTPAADLTDVLVSTNDSRTRVLVSGIDGNVAVGAKLKGHSTDGVNGRHVMATYSDDGELIISGSTDGFVHVWPTPGLVAAGKASRRTSIRSSGRDGHERVQVCDKTVSVPVALFAPSSVSRRLGLETGRIIVTGDDDGSLKMFVG